MLFSPLMLFLNYFYYFIVLLYYYYYYYYYYYHDYKILYIISYTCLVFSILLVYTH